VTPAAQVAVLRPGEDEALGVTLDDGRRLARCLRCDAWIEREPPSPGSASSEVLPPLEALPRPRRGKDLEDAILLRLIALERAVHVVLFTALAVALVFLDRNLSAIQSTANRVAADLNNIVGQTGRQPSRGWLGRRLESIGNLHAHTLLILALTAAIYAVVEGVEAVGLWKERRWAEYLTVVATAGFLPFELADLHQRVTVLRVTALIVNLAILAWLVWSKRLFGVRGGAAALHSATDWAAVLAVGPPGNSVTPSG
jgi:uncharacterized membrane protein (DUF2068 family)